MTQKCDYRPQGKVIFSQVYVSHSVDNRPHGYSVTAHPCYGINGMHPTGMLFVEKSLCSSKSSINSVKTLSWNK